AMTSSRFHREERTIDPECAEKVLRLADDAKIAWPDVLTALVAAFLQRHVGGEAIVGVPTMGRLGSASARVPAMVMNVLPVRLDVDEDAPLAEALGAVGRKLRRVRRHHRYRSEQLRRDLGLIGGERRLHGPLVNILPFTAPPVLPGLDVRVET